MFCPRNARAVPKKKKIHFNMLKERKIIILKSFLKVLINNNY